MATIVEKPIATAITTTTPASVASVAANSLAEANPKNTMDPALPSTDKSDPPTTITHVSEVSIKGSEGLKTNGTTVHSVAGDRSSLVNDIQKKIR
ncbi:hypothetical protein REPUB_Repub06bG0160700 [Reevesia pubescens]